MKEILVFSYTFSHFKEKLNVYIFHLIIKEDKDEK